MVIEIKNQVSGVRAMPGYDVILESARRYDRIYTAVENDVVFQKFLDVKEKFKQFCIDAYRAGKTPMELHKELFGERTDFSNEKSAASRVYKKIDAYYASIGEHADDPVVYKADQITRANFHQLYGSLKTLYDLLADDESIYKIDGEVTQADLREAKKGDTGIVKTVKKNKQFLADELKEELAKALVADGVTNQKTFNKIDNTREKVNAKANA